MAGGAAQGRGRDRTEREDRLRYLGVHQTRSCDFSPVRADRVCGGDAAGLMQETISKAVLKGSIGMQRFVARFPARVGRYRTACVLCFFQKGIAGGKK